MGRLKEPLVYAGYNKIEERKLKASSGGIFYELAQHIFSMQGVVFGARFDKNWNVEHGCCEKIEDIDAFLGSKYIQSHIDNIYFKVKSFLEEGRWVLFSGTPCQIYGLKAFLGEEFKTLLTMDFICHGVGSTLIWEKHLKKISHGKKIDSISFRDKTEGWINFSLKVSFSDGSYYRKNINQDIFFKGYLRNLFLRPSCYNCKFKTSERASDITLGDFWGVDNHPEIYEKSGVSIIFIHTELGKEIFKSINANLIIQEMDLWSAVYDNSSFWLSVDKPVARKTLFEHEDHILQRIQKLSKDSFSIRCYQCIKKVKFGIKKVLGKR